jgi:2-amino-4-hydroxy-6-hydroxymethyldihydropteridine diphosphokinase
LLGRNAVFSAWMMCLAYDLDTVHSMKDTFLGLGSNIGKREQNILRALSLLHKRFEILDISSLYSTIPVGYPDQDDFLNMVIKADTTALSPLELLAYVKSVEKELGREETFRWGPRVIDIDILYKEGKSFKTEALTIPHREMFTRNFVLVPLSEITDYLIIKKKKVFITDYMERKSVGDVTLYKSREEMLKDGQQ